MTKPKRSPAKVNALSFGRIVLYFMEHGDASVEELHHDTGLHPNTIREWLHAWRKLGVAHVGNWDRDVRGRPTIMRYKWGPGKDAKRPSLSMKQVRRNYVLRQQAKRLATVFKQTEKESTEPKQQAGRGP